MKNVKIDVARLAALCKLEEKEVAACLPALEKLLKFAEKIKELDTIQTQPLEGLSTPMEARLLRPDVCHDPIDPQEALNNAPESQGNFFSIPRIMGEKQ